jgi:feruloyl-CoA synthase
MSKPPFAKLNFAPAAVEAKTLPGGGMILASPQELRPYPRTLLDMLEHWAAATPDAVFLAERTSAGTWRRVSYAEALGAIRSIGQALLDRGLNGERPLAILSENSVDHGLMTFGAMAVGVPAAPISVAYSLMSRDHGKLKEVADILTPGAVYVSDGARYEAALKSVDWKGAGLIVSANPPASMPATLLPDLLRAQPRTPMTAARLTLGPETPAKILFTSGSTGTPKGVITTHRMLCSNQQAIFQAWPFLGEKPPVLVDWLPWSHTFGGSHNLNMALYHGGAVYVDEGKPMPGLIEKTVANLREIAPTLYFNVPRGYDMLLPFLEKDEDLRRNFARRLDVIFYAAAALPQNLWNRLEDVAIAARGRRIVMLSAWGSTETAPMATTVHFEIDRAGVMGLPAPGTSLKLLPTADKLEIRVKGPNVTPGYWRRPDLTQAAFDDDGYYKIGDAARLADPHDPAKGLIFDGRLAEDFKLMSGSWVHVGGLRVKLIAHANPVVADAVIAGHDRDMVGALLFPNLPACRGLCTDLAADAPPSAVVAHPAVKAKVRAALAALAAEGGGSAGRVERALLMDEPPSIDANEITDKGYLNQRAVLLRRAALVDKLYGDGPEAVRL